MKRSFMRSRNDAKLCLVAGPYSRRPLNNPPPGGDGSKPQYLKPTGEAHCPQKGIRPDQAQDTAAYC